MRWCRILEFKYCTVLSCILCCIDLFFRSQALKPNLWRPTLFERDIQCSIVIAEPALQSASYSGWCVLRTRNSSVRSAMKYKVVTKESNDCNHKK